MSETTTTKLLDTLKGKGYASDYQIGNAIGTSRQVVSRWRQQKGQMDAEFVAKAAPLAGVDGPSTLAAIEAERAQTQAGKSLFEQLHDAAELVDLLKRSPALREQIGRQMREFAETIENEEEKARFLSIARTACILCQIGAVVRPDICIRQKPRRQRLPVLSRAKTEH